jgi:hypothetical protein
MHHPYRTHFFDLSEAFAIESPLECICAIIYLVASSFLAQNELRTPSIIYSFTSGDPNESLLTNVPVLTVSNSFL